METSRDTPKKSEKWQHIKCGCVVTATGVRSGIPQWHDAIRCEKVPCAEQTGAYHEAIVTSYYTRLGGPPSKSGEGVDWARYNPPRVIEGKEAARVTGDVWAARWSDHKDRWRVFRLVSELGDCELLAGMDAEVPMLSSAVLICRAGETPPPPEEVWARAYGPAPELPRAEPAPPACAWWCGTENDGSSERISSWMHYRDFKTTWCSKACADDGRRRDRFTGVPKAPVKLALCGHGAHEGSREVCMGDVSCERSRERLAVKPPAQTFACRLGAACTHHIPPSKPPFIPGVDEWDLLGDA